MGYGATTYRNALDRGGRAGVTPAKYFTGGTDADYYQGAAGGGVSRVRTVALLWKLASLPGAGRKCAVSRVGGVTAEYEITASVAVANRLSVVVYTDAAPNFLQVDILDLVAGNVGKLFITHIAIGSGVGATVRVYDLGAEVTADTCPGAPRVAGADVATTLGRWGAGIGFGMGTWCQILSLRESTAELTPADIATDATACAASSARPMAPRLRSSAGHWDARDAGATWADRTGADTLARVGAPTVALL